MAQPERCPRCNGTMVSMQEIFYGSLGTCLFCGYRDYAQPDPEVRPVPPRKGKEKPRAEPPMQV